MWQDVRRFLEDPGEILERVREQLRGDSGEEGRAEDLVRCREDLAKRLTGKQSEKDRYVRLYVQGHISETELENYLADLKNQTANLRLLIDSVEADLSQKRKHAELAETTHAWLTTLKQRITKVEEDTQEAFRVRKQLVRLLVKGITVGEKRENGNMEVRITYRFDPPDGRDGEDDSVVDAIPNPPVFSVPNRKPPRKTKSRLPAHLHQVIRVRDLPMLPAHEAWLLLFRARADFADQFLHSSSRCSMARKLHSTFQPPHCPTLLFVRRLFVHRLRLRHSLLPLLQIGWDLVASPVEISHLRVEPPHSIGNLAGA